MSDAKDARHLSIAVKDGTLNRIRVPLQVVACWHLGDGAFDFDEKFVGVEAKAAFDEFFAIRDANPDAPVALFGHTDVSGKDDYNHQLGAQRAQAVLGVLNNDPDLWFDLFAEDRESLQHLKAGLAEAGHEGLAGESGFGPLLCDRHAGVGLGFYNTRASRRAGRSVGGCRAKEAVGCAFACL